MSLPPRTMWSTCIVFLVVCLPSTTGFAFNLHQSQAESEDVMLDMLASVTNTDTATDSGIKDDVSFMEAGQPGETAAEPVSYFKNMGKQLKKNGLKKTVLVLMHYQQDVMQYSPLLGKAGALAVLGESKEYLALVDKRLEDWRNLQKHGEVGPIVFTRDWHEDNHVSFAVTGEDVDFITKFPVHCVQDTDGAKWAGNLERFVTDERIISMGGKEDKRDGNPLKPNFVAVTGHDVEKWISEEIDTVILTGLAGDFVVKSTAIFIRNHQHKGDPAFKLNVIILKDMTRSMDQVPMLTHKCHDRTEALGTEGCVTEDTVALLEALGPEYISIINSGQFKSVDHLLSKRSVNRLLFATNLQKDATKLWNGRLAVPGTDGKFVTSTQELVRSFITAEINVGHRVSDVLVETGDLHPNTHASFISQGGDFPPHCVKGTQGSESIFGEYVPHDKFGTDFWDISMVALTKERQSKLLQLMESTEPLHVYVFGLAGDFVVFDTVKALIKLRASADPAKSASMKLYVISDVTRSLNRDSQLTGLSKVTTDKVTAGGVVVI